MAIAPGWRIILPGTGVMGEAAGMAAMQVMVVTVEDSHLFWMRLSS